MGAYCCGEQRPPGGPEYDDAPESPRRVSQPKVKAKGRWVTQSLSEEEERQRREREEAEERERKDREARGAKELEEQEAKKLEEQMREKEAKEAKDREEQEAQRQRKEKEDKEALAAQKAKDDQERREQEARRKALEDAERKAEEDRRNQYDPDVEDMIHDLHDLKAEIKELEGGDDDDFGDELAGAEQHNDAHWDPTARAALEQELAEIRAKRDQLKQKR